MVLLVPSPDFDETSLRHEWKKWMAADAFRPLAFCEDVIVGSRKRKKTTSFDYANHQIIIIKERKGTVKEKRLPLPPDETYYDPITASYNFRFGAFGPVERGSRVYSENGS